MREQHIRTYIKSAKAGSLTTTPAAQLTRHVNQQDRLESPLKQRIIGPRWVQRPPNQPALTPNPQRVQHEESIIPQPQHPSRNTAGRERDGEVGVANDFGDRPGDEHGGVGWRAESCGVWKGFDDEPYEEVAGGDLHECCEERGTDETCIEEKERELSLRSSYTRVGHVCVENELQV